MMIKNSTQDTLHQINRLVQAGYDQFDPRGWRAEQLAAACDQRLAAWELAKQLTTPQIRSLDDFDAAYPSLPYFRQAVQQDRVLVYTA